MTRLVRALTASSLVAFLVLGFAPGYADSEGSSLVIDPTEHQISQALDLQGLSAEDVTKNAHPEAMAIGRTPFGNFPTAGSEYLILSTGRAGDVLGGDSDDFLSTELDGAPTGADGNDLNSVTLILDPPAAAKCLAFDFQFLSEEYPDYVGSSYNDIFTAELITRNPLESEFYMEGDQVIAPLNFAYDAEGNYISINTVLGLSETTGGTGMNGATAPLVAVTPIKQDTSTDPVAVILSIQDIGDSVYDSAVLIDNLRWFYNDSCQQTIDTLTDTDGDSLPDHWETDGVDRNGDGDIDLPLHEMGADPHVVDIFIEVDWMERSAANCLPNWLGGGCMQTYRTTAPNPGALQDVVDAFADSSYDDGRGINVHIDAGWNSPGEFQSWRTGGNPLPWTGVLGSCPRFIPALLGCGEYDWSEFHALKNTNMDPSRREVFHYVIYAANWGHSANTSTGTARYPGVDFVMRGNSFQGNSERSRRAEAGTFMHELGHNLLLSHGSRDHNNVGRDHEDFEFYQGDRDYLSVLNYTYQRSGLDPIDYSDSGPLNDWENLDFTRNGLIGLDAAGAPDLPMVTDNHHVKPAPAEPGTGGIFIEGPEFLAAGESHQSVVVELENYSSTDEDFTVQVELDDGTLLSETAVTLDGHEMATALVEIDSSELSVGEHTLIFSLWSETLHEEVGFVESDITALDLSDEDVVAAVQQLFDDSHADDGLHPAVLDVVESLVDTHAVEDSETPSSTPTPEESPSPTPEESPIPDEPETAEPSPTDSASLQPTESESPTTPEPTETTSATVEPDPSPTDDESTDTPTETGTPSDPDEPEVSSPHVDDLVADLEGRIYLETDIISPGDDFEVLFQGEPESSTVSLYLFSDPTQLGDYEVENSAVSATLPGGVEHGEHRLAAYDAESSEIIGWTYITVGTQRTEAPTESATEAPPTEQSETALAPTPSVTDQPTPSENLTTSIPSSAPGQESETAPARTGETADPAPTSPSTSAPTLLPTPTESAKSTQESDSSDGPDSEDAATADDSSLPLTGSTALALALAALACLLIGAGAVIYRHRQAR